MDIDDLSKEDINITSRHRSPSFNKQEIELLVDFVEKYRIYVLNKSITSVACQAKELVWMKIARKFNSAGIGPDRSADNLRVKWENLKRDTRRASKNLLDVNKGDLDELNVRVMQLLNAMEDMGPIDAPQDISDNETNVVENGSDEQKHVPGDIPQFWNDNLESDVGDEQRDKSARNRSPNFSPHECKLLLQCVRKEKQLIFSKETTGKAIEMKNRAWSRVANSYNQLSPQKRGPEVLKTKFMSMKKMAKKIGSKTYIKDITRNKKLEKFGKQLEGYQNIKTEPLVEEKLDVDSDRDDADFAAPEEGAHCVEVGANCDPLSAVLNNGDSGIGSSSSSNMTWNWNQSENKEIVKLKQDLLNYQLETAKLERKRLEDSMKEEERARLAKETEQSLRLRAARLEATAAAMRLPPNHPALHFPPEENPAHAYLTQTQYHHT